MSEKKAKKLNLSHLASLLAARGHDLVLLDLDRGLEEQGPFGAIVHKVSDEIAKAAQGDVAAKTRIHAFEVTRLSCLRASLARAHRQPRRVAADPELTPRFLVSLPEIHRRSPRGGCLRSDQRSAHPDGPEPRVQSRRAIRSRAQGYLGLTSCCLSPADPASTSFAGVIYAPPFVELTDDDTQTPEKDSKLTAAGVRFPLGKHYVCCRCANRV